MYRLSFENLGRGRRLKCAITETLLFCLNVFAKWRVCVGVGTASPHMFLSILRGTNVTLTWNEICMKNIHRFLVSKRGVVHILEFGAWDRAHTEDVNWAIELHDRIMANFKDDEYVKDCGEYSRSFATSSGNAFLGLVAMDPISGGTEDVDMVSLLNTLPGNHVAAKRPRENDRFGIIQLGSSRVPDIVRS